ncbi:MAG TPA: DUF488 domain-containing protein [Longimicrobiaceae bacterium]|nr:DUF488 domain-containing protein [Longimicrobiaceae bacterium]
MAPPVFTIGHSTRTADEFLGLLRENGIRLLVDVRRFPGSRRHPHVGSAELAAGLRAAGIEYRHEPDLGGRRDPRPDSPNTAWRNASFRAYADHMDSPEFRAALERLLADSAARPTVVMCAEAVPWRCHRNLIADALIARGAPVLDVLAPGKTVPHAINPHAVVLAGGRVVYPAEGGGTGDLFTSAQE